MEHVSNNLDKDSPMISKKANLDLLGKSKIKWCPEYNSNPCPMRITHVHIKELQWIQMGIRTKHEQLTQ